MEEELKQQVKVSLAKFVMLSCLFVIVATI